MAPTHDALPQSSHTSMPSPQPEARSVSRIRLESRRSDVRDLSRGGLEPDRESEVFPNDEAHQPLRSPLPDSARLALDRYGAHLSGDSEIMRHLRAGNLSQAVVTLLRENHVLSQNLEASRADFEALRSFNVIVQEQVEEAMGVADDQRIQLLEDLERASDENLALETLFERLRAGYEEDLEQSRQRIEALEAEMDDLRSQLFGCEAL